jgi:hypothetical protein
MPQAQIALAATILCKTAPSASVGDYPSAPILLMVAAEWLVGVIARERSISRQDIDQAASNIALMTEEDPRRVSNCVVTYDAV